MNVEGEGSSSKSEFGVMQEGGLLGLLGLVASSTRSWSASAFWSLGVLRPDCFSHHDSTFSAAHVPQTSETLSPESETDRATCFAA
jgi:hypothetical protein